MLLSVFLVILGFVFLIKGADWMVNGSTLLARKNKIPDLVIGLTIVAFGTSAPELVVNTVASYENHSDIVLGNIIGSNNFNLFMILGIVGLIFPIAVQSSTVWKEIPISFVAAIVFLVLANGYFIGDMGLSRIDGLILLSLFFLFLFYVYKQMKTDETVAEAVVVTASNTKIWGYIVLGLIGLVIGGKLIVDNAVTIASDLGVSEKIIGLTIIAAGTSLPELMTSVVAALKKNSDIAIGNIIGSNIFNIFLILSVSSLVRPIAFSPVFNMDIYLLLGGTLFLFLAMFTGKKKTLERWQSAVLLLIFIGYTTYLVGKELQ
ncbi:cation:H+ antiporter [Gelidibacter algens]|uniref:Cation:H+ antiporter n=1 Tax=Gelidibacter algens TaxID=49280 RepID=A0A1A7R3R8_9FLAO|nr:calcium/sodium antiporter [Gelidibacter algens]OBX26104.1 sodium:proton exchanger [Gelidibacter algens]RAJ22933.1 cation:H+ antiporter [Gelidibacter algens]